MQKASMPAGHPSMADLSKMTPERIREIIAAHGEAMPAHVRAMLSAMAGQAQPADPNGTQEGHSFEAGQRRMMDGKAERIEDVTDFRAAETGNALQDAFAGKAIVHPSTDGRPMMVEEAQQAVMQAWNQARERTSLAYIHVPFCQTRCLYCMFYQNPLQENSSKHYTDTVIAEMQLTTDRAAQRGKPIEAVYFGGGTPTALEPADLKRLLAAVKQYLPLANDCEITLEGRIFNFDDAKIEAAFEGGVNRISLGAQTFNTQVRQTMRRVDDRETMIKRIEKIASYNQCALVCDLIYGFPNQTRQVWADDVATAMSLPLDGLDCYQLNVFEKSPLGKFIANGKLPAGANQRERGEYFAESVRMLTQGGWHRLSNNHWGRPDKWRERNIYNRFAKGNADCLAFGSGAGGKLHGTSFMLERDYKRWAQAVSEGVKPVMFASAPSANWDALRTVSSEMELGRINPSALSEQFHLPIQELTQDVFEQWTRAGLIAPQGDWMVQSVAGQFWHVTMSQLLINVLKQRLAR